MEQNFFGSDTYFSWLQEGTTAGDAAVMEQMLMDVNDYARRTIRGKVPFDEVEDVVMAVDCALLTHLAAYLRNSQDYAPYQRQRWLKTLIRNTMLDHLAEAHPENSWRDRKRDPNRGDPIQLISWEEYSQDQDLPGDSSPEETVLGASTGEVLDRLIVTLSELRAEPAALLAFLYHNVVFFLEGDSQKKGKPEETAHRLGGRTLGELQDALPSELCRTVGTLPSPKALQALDVPLQGHRDEVFRYDSRKISASVSYLKQRIKTKQEKQL